MERTKAADLRAALATHHWQMPQISAYRLDWTASQPPLLARQKGDTPRRWTHVR